MSRISYSQLIKNIANTYRDATGSSELVAIGELVDKLAEAMNNTDSGIDIEYKSIIYNEDDTITLIDNDDVTHTMTCVYEDNKITAITLDGEEIKLSYDSDNLIAVEDTVVNFDSIISGGNSSEEDETPKGLYHEFDFSTLDLSNNSSTENAALYLELLSNNVLYVRGPISGRTFIDLSNFFNIPVNEFEILKTYTFEFTVTDFSYTSSSYGYLNEFELHLPDGTYTEIPIDGNGVYKSTFTFSSLNRDFIIYHLRVAKTYSYSLSDLKIYEVVEGGSSGDTGSSGESSSTDNTNITKTKDFQNGFIVGLASKGKVTQKTMSCESNITEVVLPVNAQPIPVEINSNNISVETSVALESEE